MPSQIPNRPGARDSRAPGDSRAPDAPAVLPLGAVESPSQRADRNWTELTQELRVTQTGVQILTAFLLILPFQQRFTDVSAAGHAFYLGLVSLSIVTTTLMVVPVSLHRFLLHRGMKARMVQLANRVTMVALVFLGLTIIGSVAFVFAVVASVAAAIIASVLTLVMLILLWLVFPLRIRMTG